MMKNELEAIAGRAFTTEQFESINALYMESDLDKFSFVKSMKNVLNSLPKAVDESARKVMGIRDNSGYYWTPNGCWRHLVDVEILDVNIKTGKIKVRIIPNTYRLGYTADFNIGDPMIEVAD